MRMKMIDALEKRYEAIIAESFATIEIYMDKPVAIGEHPQHLDEIDKLLSKICEAEHKLEILLRMKHWWVLENYLLTVLFWKKHVKNVKKLMQSDSLTQEIAEHKQFIADREEALNRAETALAKLQ